MRIMSAASVCLAGLVLAACSGSDSTSPTGLAPSAGPAMSRESAASTFDFVAVLRGDGFGLVKLRQPTEGARLAFLDVRVHDLEPNASYRLQRAVDRQLDGVCTSTTWLTLGKGSVPQTIDTDARGRGRVELFRDLSAFPVGTAFDIHFQVVDAGGAVVLTSKCYRFTVR
jgi:hypothetical protein